MSYAARVESHKFAFATIARSGRAPINVVQGEAAALPLPSANVGMAVASMVFQDVEDPMGR